MTLLLPLFVICIIIGILVVFSRDWVPIIRRYYQIFYVKLFIPLMLISCFVVKCKTWIIWVLWLFWAGYVKVLESLVGMMPFFPRQIVFFQILIITVLSVLPTLFAYLTAKPYRPFKPPYWASVLMWIGLATLISLLEGSL